MKVIGYKIISKASGVAIYEVNDKMAVAAFVQMYKVDAPRQHKIYYNKDGNAYFNLHGCRHYLNDFIHI